MTRETRLLRALLVMLLVGLILASGLLYIVSLDLAAVYPKLAHLRLPIYLAVLVGLAGVWIAAWVTMGQTKAYMFLPWLAAEVVTLFVFTLVALLERLFAAALELRRENELKV